MRKVLTMAAVASLCGCAPHTQEIQATYVSATQYTNLSCSDIQAELNIRIEKLKELGARIDKEASRDEAQAGVGVVLFWPILFALEGSDTEESKEYGQTRGEANALEDAARINRCPQAIALAEEWHQQEATALEAMEKEKKRKEEEASFGY